MTKETSTQYEGLNTNEILALTNGEFQKVLGLKRMKEACERGLSEIDRRVDLNTEEAANFSKIIEGQVRERSEGGLRDANFEITQEQNAALNKKYEVLAKVRDNLAGQMAELTTSNPELDKMLSRQKDYKMRGIDLEVPEGILSSELSSLIKKESADDMDFYTKTMADIETALKDGEAAA